MDTTEPAAAPTSRAEKHGANLRRILDAAMEVIVTNGFAALSINKLAGGLGFTPGALYRYFPSKDALLAELVAEIIDDIGERIAEATAATNGTKARGKAAETDPLAPISRAANAWRDYARTSPHRFGLVAALLASPQIVITEPEPALTAIGHMVKALTPLALAFEHAATMGVLEPGDARERTLLLFAGLQGVLNLRKQAERAPDQLDLDRLYAAMFDALMRGFGRTPTLPPLGARR
jgi:AcrR family transcriptional regulator